MFEIDPWCAVYWTWFLTMLRGEWHAHMSTPCMVWCGLRNQGGHGLLLFTDHPTMNTHRYVFQMVTGVDPGGAYVLHRCDNPPCCAPWPG